LRLERLDAELGSDHRRFRPHLVGLLGLEVGPGLLRALHGARASLHQILRPRVLLLGKLQLGLGLLELRLGLGDLFALGSNLSFDIGDVALRAGNLALGLIDRDKEIALVDLREGIACLHLLVVGDENLGDEAADFRRNGKAARGDEGVVGGFEMPDPQPVRDPARDGREQNADAEERQ
jgi:hypothetical protein